MDDKHRRFAEEYITDHNATRAAKRAGYSEKTAYSQGNRLLKNADVKNYIAELEDKMRSEKVADAQEVLEYLTSVMRGEETEEVIMLVDGDIEKTKKEVSAKDRIRAAENLGKRYSLFSDNVNLNGGVRVVNIVDDVPEGDDNE